MFMSKTVIFVVYVNDFLFWECSQSDIDNIMKYFKDYGSSYNLVQSKVAPVSEFLGIFIKTLDDGVFQFY